VATHPVSCRPNEATLRTGHEVSKSLGVAVALREVCLCEVRKPACRVV